MSQKVVTPAFLTEGVAKQAIHYVMQIVYNLAPILPSSAQCHIVILVPSRTVGEGDGESSFPRYPIKPHLLYEESFGEPEQWPHDFKEIARCKAQKLWDGRDDGRTDCQPHLLLQGDTPWYGGVRRDGIVVTCSGFESYFDVMISGMIADILIGLSYHAWADAEKTLKGDFLPEDEA